MIKLIAAVSSDGIIGTTNNELPWIIAADLKRFKEKTMGGILVVGRKTFESLNSRPLPGREMAVITRNKRLVVNGVKFFTSLEDCITFYSSTKKTIWIAGGGTLYASAMPYVEEMLITKVHLEIGRGIYFPPINDTNWKVSDIELGGIEGNITYDFITYQKINLDRNGKY